jgi:hypothetical protein
MDKKPPSDQNIFKAIMLALQGLAFWISYRQALFHEHHLNEGALVVELAGLLKAKLNTSFKVFNESKFGDKNKTRMDIEIVERDKNNNMKRIAIIEVKRDLASVKEIKDDIEKLVEAKNKDILCYLIVVSENKPPKILEKPTKKDNAGTKFKLKKEFSANVKKFRLFKSMKSFSGKNGNIPQANYCCLLEISSSIKGEA